MKILLIKPYWPYPYGKKEHTYNRIWPPLSLANCAAILEKDNHTVKILDAHALRIPPGKIKEYVRGYDKVFITSSTLDRWQCPNIELSTFFETTRNICCVTDEFYVLGYHGTVDPQGIWQKTQAKAIVRGAPEFTVREICKDISFDQIKGISFEQNGRFISTGDRLENDIKLFPVPAFHLLDMTKYKYEILGRNFALFEIARGCNFPCKFCNKIMYEPKFQRKTSAQVIEEVRQAIEKHKVKTGYFIDLEFLSSKDVVSDLCDFLIEKKYNFKWCCQTRADSITPAIARKMKQAGCQIIHVGVESGIQKFLDLADKRTTEEKIKNGIDICRQEGIKTLAFFMFGYKGETGKDRNAIFNFAKDLNTNYVSFHKVYPYRKSDMYLEEINSNEEVDGYIRQTYIRYYCRWEYLRGLNFKFIFQCFELLLGRLKTL